MHSPVRTVFSETRMRIMGLVCMWLGAAIGYIAVPSRLLLPGHARSWLIVDAASARVELIVAIVLIAAGVILRLVARINRIRTPLEPRVY